MKRTACNLSKFFLLAFFLTLLPWQVACAGGQPRTVDYKAPHSPKRSAPIDITYSVPTQNNRGENIPVTITIRTLADASSLKLELTADSGLAMSLGTTYFRDYGSRLRNVTVSESLTVASKTGGRLYINVFVTGIFNGKTMMQVTSIPVSIGTATTTTKQQASDKTSQSIDSTTKQKIIIMPAEENGKK